MHLTQNKNYLAMETFPVGSLGCNTSLVYSPKTLEALIIDPGNDAPYLLRIIREKHLQVKLLLHTHAHFDHIGGSGKIFATCQSPIWLHRGDEFLYQGLPQQGLFFGETLDTPPPLEHYLEDLQSFGFTESANTLQDPSLNSFLHTLHTPGHTPGSCSFYTEYFDQPILFSGDTLFQSSIGRTDLPGGDYNLILKSIRQRLYPLPDETFCIPGHGLPTHIYQEKKSNPFVRA